MSTHNTRSPTHPRGAQRPPKGPRVPPRSSDVSKAQLARLKPLIDSAIETLRSAGHVDLSDAVKELAERTPGWGGRTPKAPDSFFADVDLMARVTEQFPDRPVTGIVEDGVRRFLAGNLAPVPSTGRTGAGTKVKVNIRMDVTLGLELKQRCAAMSDPEHPEYPGWRVRPMHVYLAALREVAAAK